MCRIQTIFTSRFFPSTDEVGFLLPFLMCSLFQPCLSLSFQRIFFPPTFYHILGTLGIQIYTKSKAFFLSSSDRFQVIIFAWKALFRTKIHTELWKADILKRDHIKILNFWFPLHHSDQNQTSFRIILSPAEPAFCLMSLTW